MNNRQNISYWWETPQNVDVEESKWWKDTKVDLLNELRTIDHLGPSFVNEIQRLQKLLREWIYLKEKREIMNG